MKRYQAKAIAKYRKAHMTSVSIRLHNTSDRAVLDKLASVDDVYKTAPPRKAGEGEGWSCPDNYI